MSNLTLSALAISLVTACGSTPHENIAPHKNRMDPNAERVIAAMPGDLRGVAAVNLPRALESETMALLLAPLFEDESIRTILTDAEKKCGISFLDDVTRVFMGFGQGNGRVTFAILGKFNPRHFAACARSMVEAHAGDRVTIEKRESGFGVLVSEPALRIEVIERDGVIMFDVPRLTRAADGRRVFEPTTPVAGERGSLADNADFMKTLAEIDTQQAVWMVSGGEPSKGFLTEPPMAMWLDASATKGLDIELGLRYSSGDAAEIGRTALDTVIDTFLGSPAREMVKRIKLTVSGSDAVLTARFDPLQTNQLAALLVTAIGG